jgi:hypothetical protein
MDKLNNSEDVKEFLKGLGLHINEEVVRKVVNVLSGEVHQSLYSLYKTRPDKPTSICGKGTAYKIKNLYDKGKLQPYLNWLSQSPTDVKTGDTQGKPVLNMDQIIQHKKSDHWNDLAEAAEKIRKNIEAIKESSGALEGNILSGRIVTSPTPTISGDEKIPPLRRIDSLLAEGLLTHLKYEFPEFNSLSSWKLLKQEDILIKNVVTPEMLIILRTVGFRRTFMDICKI